MSQASEVYARLLLPKRLGFPLWNPAPDDNLVVEYREKGVSIGDVGIITSDGEFDFLFNICVPPDHAINQYGVPADFEDVSGSIQISKNAKHHAPGTNIASNSKEDKAIDTSVVVQDNPHVPIGTGAGFNFTFSTSEGAILLLPEGGSQENLRDRGSFMDQALKHGLAWYEYANVTRRRLAENGSLYLVTGCDKTKSWGIASFSNSSGGNELSFKFTAAQIASGNASRSYKWETSSPATVRYGPITEDQDALELQSNASQRSGRSRRRRGRGGRRVEDSENQSTQDRPLVTHQLLQNQCVLVRGYRISIRPATLAKLKGPLKVSAIQDTDPSDIFNRSGTRNIPFRDGGSGKRSWFGDVMKKIGGGSGGQQSSGRMSRHQDVVLASIPTSTKVYYPSVAINDYLLETVPLAEVAVTHDSEWWDLCNSDDDLPSIDKLVGRLESNYRPSIQLVSGGLGVSLAPKVADHASVSSGPKHEDLRRENNEDFRFPADTRPDTKGKKQKGPSTNETYIFVQPPPSRSNHPHNLQIQLVPPPPRRDRDAGNYQPLDLSSDLPPTADHDCSRSVSIAHSFADSGYGSNASTSSYSTTASRRTIIPLYNLHAHNVMINSVLDAGTDAKVAKFQIYGLEIVGLAILEPVEVWEDDLDVVFSRKDYHMLSDMEPSLDSTSQTRGSLSLRQENAIEEHAQISSAARLGAPLHKSPRDTLTGPKKASRWKLTFGSKLPSAQLPLAIDTMSTPTLQPRPSLPLSREKQTPAPLFPGPTSLSTRSFLHDTVDTLSGPVLGMQSRMSSTARPYGRPSKYVWIVSRWLKGIERDLMGSMMKTFNINGKDSLWSKGTRLPVGQTEVRFEWTRSKTRPEVRKRTTSIDLGRPRGRNEQGNVSPTSSLIVHLPSEDDNESDSEDSETAWKCTLFVRRIASPPSTHPTTAPSAAQQSQDDRAICLKIATLNPTPHHPKVVSMLKMPFPLPDIQVDELQVHQRNPQGIAPDITAGLIMTAEEIKDVVSCTSLWLVVREGIGGVGKVTRKGDGWRVRV